MKIKEKTLKESMDEISFKLMGMMRPVFRNSSWKSEMIFHLEELKNQIEKNLEELN